MRGIFHKLSISFLISLFLFSSLSFAQELVGTQLCEALFERHGFLEEIEGERAMEWVKGQNKRTLNVLRGDPRLAALKEKAFELLTAEDRIKYGYYRGKKYISNYWRDEKHLKGLLRQCSIRSFMAGNPNWEVILDIDALAENEGINWSLNGLTRFADDESIALVSLSIDGKDAKIFREYNPITKQFVEGGFELPESKSDAVWLDKNTLLVSSAFEASELTDSGYPRVIKRWKRGTSFKNAEIIYEGDKKDVSVWVSTMKRAGTRHIIVGRNLNFNEGIRFLMGQNGELRSIPTPKNAAIQSYFKENYILILNSDWHFHEQTFTQGSLVHVNLDKLLAGDTDAVELMMEASPKRVITGAYRTKDHIIVDVLENVRGKLIQMRRGAKKWLEYEIPLPAMGTVSVVSNSSFHHQAFLNFQNFLTPSTVYAYNARTRKLQPFKSAPSRFDASKYEAHQYFATSKDGTQVPYFVIAKKDIRLDGSNPTILYGYGGFESFEVPVYLPMLESLWMSQGGVYVEANIRGGGEFGPSWHQAGLKENRQRIFDDFIAVSEDLIARGITSPKHLGITGGSNGGLLTGVAVTQRPDLYNAVRIGVPLLDMMRYHKLLAGASWMAEYGDPDDPKIRPRILAYSPYHNLNADTEYPEVFFDTANDDRVHPGHARKMARYMEELGHNFLFFENPEGGHTGDMTPELSAEDIAQGYIYFLQKLKD